MKSTLDPTTVRVVIAAGGTGGHIAPALALGEAIEARHPEASLTFFCGDKPFESRLYRAAGHQPIVIESRPLVKGAPIRAAKNSLALVRSVIAARRTLRDLKADVVVGMGGYVAAPVMLAARTLGIPTYLHEQNAVPGRANRMLSWVASRTSAADPRALETLRGQGRKFVPNPLPRRILRGDAAVGFKRYGLDPERPVVLVLGGSQGASALNNMVFEAGTDLAAKFGEHAPQFLWLTGDREHDSWKERAADADTPAGVFYPLPFVEGIEHAYATADLVVSRAGAGTIAELLATGQPSILVPYPHAVGDHQAKNALRVARGGAAIVVSESELTGESLSQMIGELLVSPSKMRRMSAAAVSLARPDAADIMAELVIGLIRPRRPEAATEEEDLGAHAAMALP